jgi:hypothetical protein
VGSRKTFSASPPEKIAVGPKAGRGHGRGRFSPGFARKRPLVRPRRKRGRRDGLVFFS